VPGNDKVGISFTQPKTIEERNKIAKQCCASLEITMPLLVDTIDDRVGHAYSGMPDRLYVIDRSGKVAYQGGRGPFGFNSLEMEQALILLLLEETVAKTSGRTSLLNHDAAWKHLPPALQGKGQRLPNWALALAKTMPYTTAAMLELDYLHRARNPLDPLLRGKMRWLAARSNGCAYTQEIAAADLKRAGVEGNTLKDLAENLDKLPEPERAALVFASKMTLAAHTVTDSEVKTLIRHHGEKNVVAMVLLLAHANFQDRLILSLGLQASVPEPLEPVHVTFQHNIPIPHWPRKEPTGTAAAKSGSPVDSDWLAVDFATLKKRMEAQKARQPRIKVPSWDEVLQAAPGRGLPKKPLGILWSRVCLGYQPELAMGWSACTRAFQEESHLDRVLEESIFWVVTRSLECFY
jgi:alkylhydroperoxidase family enzyme